MGAQVVQGIRQIGPEGGITRHQLPVGRHRLFCRGQGLLTTPKIAVVGAQVVQGTRQIRQERRVALRQLPKAIDPRRASIHRVGPEICPEIGLLLGRPARAAPGEGRLPQRFGQRHSFPISHRLPGSGPGRGA